MLKVMKFGGWALRNAQGFLKVREIVKRENGKLILVVSAVSGVTDFLLNSISSIKQAQSDASCVISYLYRKHLLIISQAIATPRRQSKAKRKVLKKLGELKELLEQINSTQNLETNILIKNAIISYGERLAAILLAYVFADCRLNSVALEADKIGILTDHCFENAQVDLSRVKERLQGILSPLVSNGIIPIITGFFGSTEEGLITTFGRNGSDYTAAIIAASVEADELIYWKNTEGLMSADPKLVRRAQKIDRLSFKEAAELSFLGAKILHRRSLEPLFNSKVVIKIKNICAPEKLGTKILYTGGKNSTATIKSVLFNQNIALVKVFAYGIGFKPEVIGKIVQQLSRTGSSLYSITTTHTTINFLLDSSAITTVKQIIQAVLGDAAKQITIKTDCALIAVIGEGAIKKRGLVAKILSLIVESCLGIEQIPDASDIAWYFITSKKETVQAVKIIHKHLLE